MEKYEPYVRDVYTPYAEGVYQQPKEIYSSPQIISTTYHGFTGNSDDDSAYTRYDNNGYEGYQGGGYSGGYVQSAGQPLPYNLVVSHSILHWNFVDVLIYK